jgi:choline transport protein
MSDEIVDAPKKVPWTMVIGVGVDGAVALAMMITILFCLGPLDGALTAPTNGYPIIEVLYVATKSRAAATVIMSLIICCGVTALFNGLASTTRLTWAFARDHGLPFSGYFSYVSARPMFL